MGHFYKDGKLIECKGPADARKKGAYASVTTKIKYVSTAGGVSFWRENEVIRLAREHPELSAKEIGELAWGTRTTPNGEEVPSSEWGIRFHSMMENRDWWHMYPKWKPWLDAASDAIHTKEEIWCVANEYVVSSNELRTAGSIDLLGKNWDTDKWVLVDYKCRSGKTPIHRRVYETDCEQLAIESYMVQQEYGLDYLPDIYSLVVDTDEPKVHLHKWSEKDRDWGIVAFRAKNLIYFRDHGI